MEDIDDSLINSINLELEERLTWGQQQDGNNWRRIKQTERQNGLRQWSEYDSIW